MKRIFSILTLFLLLTAAASPSANAAKGWNNEQKKTVKVTFDKLAADAAFVASNLYGDINIVHGKGRSLEFEAVITTDAPKRRNAERLLENIEVTVCREGADIVAKTDIGDIRGRDNSRMTIRIDYFVTLPADMRLDINNRYGNIAIARKGGIHKGKCDIKASYGDIHTCNLAGETEISSKYGNVTTGNLSESAVLTLAYCSGVKIGDAKRLRVKSDYSNMTLGNVEAMGISLSYGNLKAESVKNSNIRMRYSKARINEMGPNIKHLDLSYSTLRITTVSADFRDMDIVAVHSKVLMGMPQTSKFRVEGINLRYGSCKIGRGFKVEERRPTTDAATGYDSSRSNRERRDGCNLEVNGATSTSPLIKFDGRNYSSLSISSTSAKKESDFDDIPEVP